ncbi:selenocysteine-specific translation elongation factor [Crenalkalicoccus roseus]|uniref:selenocysteine-specific translation elongation factor n=1 Tax=Crenalkalicoccus roseus TaxID=1485588 RepID=UPI0010800436|nr:selenocysteine-specific translation elongation factor [Crenalkalicoccus roseus]
MEGSRAGHGGGAAAPAASLLVGVMGHVDHGKTALVRALTGTDTDRLREEKARGISIALGFALLRAGGAEIDLVDMPGHERFVRTMIAGASGIEAALIVVSAAEGVRRQTREHLEIAGLLGLCRGVVAVAQCDRATEEAAAAAGAEALSCARACGFGPMEVVRTSALAGEGLEALAAALARLAHAAPPRAEHGLFQLPLDRAFALPGIGPVATGTLRRGRLAAGEEAELLPGGCRVRLRSLQMHGRAVAAAGPGRRVAAGLRGVGLAALRRGRVLATPGAAREAAWLDVRLSLLASAPRPLGNGAVLRLLTGTQEASARLRLPGGGALPPGGTVLAQLLCVPPVAAMAGDGFVLRRPSPPLTVGGGTILDLPPAPRRPRAQAAAEPRLRAAAGGDWAGATRLLLRELGLAGAAPPALAPRLGHAPARLRAWALEGGARALPDGTLVDGEAWRSGLAALRGALAAFHAARPMEPGMRPEALLAALPRGAAAPVAGALLGALLAEGAAARAAGGLIRAASHDPARALGGDDRALVQAMEALFREAGLAPPDTAAAVAGDPRRLQALRLLLGSGVLVRATDRVQGRSLLFHREALAQAQRRIAEALAGPEGFAAREAGALLGISRKFSIPLLEHLDAIRFTRRVGDRRFVQAAEAPGAASARP